MCDFHALSLVTFGQMFLHMVCDHITQVKIKFDYYALYSSWDINLFTLAGNRGISILLTNSSILLPEKWTFDIFLGWAYTPENTVTKIL